MYRVEIMLKPEIHEGRLKHYWHIFLLDGEDKLTVEHGYANSYLDACTHAYSKGSKYV